MEPRRKSPGHLRSSALPLCLLVGLFPPPSPARDWIVNPESGADTSDGSAAAPLATAQAAVDKAGPGDRVVLLPEGAIYRQCIDLGKAPAGMVLDGNGVTLDGGGEREHGVVAQGDTLEGAECVAGAPSPVDFVHEADDLLEHEPGGLPVSRLGRLSHRADPCEVASR